MLIIRTAVHYYVLLISAPGRVSGVISTSDSVTWSPPANVPNGCHVQYSIAGNGTTLVVNTNMASSAALNGAGFPYCVGLTVTITPLDFNNETVDTSSASVELVINNPGSYNYFRHNVVYVF